MLKNGIDKYSGTGKNDFICEVTVLFVFNSRNDLGLSEGDLTSEATNMQKCHCIT